MRKSQPLKNALSGLQKQRFRRSLLSWYGRNKRDLPWRKDRDPYRVWLSEIMLQQTRVAAVVDHYQKFLRRFPTVERLSAAREPSVLAVWSGLGYYRRARMLHAAAKQIMRKFGGEFPSSEVALRALPGIGRYTAAAVASIAFGEATAVVDGNVERVLQRLLGERLEGEELWSAANDLLSQQQPGNFNQALMELGAMVCTPRQPKCLLCPVNAMCTTRGELKARRKKSIQTKREIAYLLDSRDEKVFLVQRAKDALLMPGMWELPEIAHPNGAKPWLILRHSITMTDYTVRVLRDSAPEGLEGHWIAESRVASLPVTGLAKKILRKAEIL